MAKKKVSFKEMRKRAKAQRRAERDGEQALETIHPVVRDRSPKTNLGEILWTALDTQGILNTKR